MALWPIPGRSGREGPSLPHLQRHSWQTTEEMASRRQALPHPTCLLAAGTTDSGQQGQCPQVWPLSPLQPLLSWEGESSQSTGFWQVKLPAGSKSRARHSAEGGTAKAGPWRHSGGLQPLHQQPHAGHFGRQERVQDEHDGLGAGVQSQRQFPLWTPKIQVEVPNAIVCRHF